MLGPSGGGRLSCSPLVIGRCFEDHLAKNSGAPCPVGRCSRSTDPGLVRKLGPRPGPYGGAIGAWRVAACRNRHHQSVGRRSVFVARQGRVGGGLSCCRDRLQRRVAGHAGHSGQARRRQALPAHRQRPRRPGAVCRCDPRAHMVQRPPGARVHAAARSAGQHSSGQCAGPSVDCAVDVGSADAARRPPRARRAASGCRACAFTGAHAARDSDAFTCPPCRHRAAGRPAGYRQRRRVQGAPG